MSKATVQSGRCLAEHCLRHRPGSLAANEQRSVRYFDRPRLLGLPLRQRIGLWGRCPDRHMKRDDDALTHRRPYIHRRAAYLTWGIPVKGCQFLLWVKLRRPGAIHRRQLFLYNGRVCFRLSPSGASGKRIFTANPCGVRFSASIVPPSPRHCGVRSITLSRSGSRRLHSTLLCVARHNNGRRCARAVR